MKFEDEDKEDGKLMPQINDKKKPPSTPVNKQNDKQNTTDDSNDKESLQNTKKNMLTNFFSEKKINTIKETTLMFSNDQTDDNRNQNESPEFGTKNNMKSACLKTHKRASTIVEHNFDKNKLKIKLKELKKVIGSSQTKHKRRCKSRVTHGERSNTMRRPRKAKSSFDLKHNKNDSKNEKKIVKKNTKEYLKILDTTNMQPRKKSAVYGYRCSQTHSFIDWKCFNFEEQDNEGSSNSSSVSSNNSVSQLDFNYTIKLNDKSR